MIAVSLKRASALKIGGDIALPGALNSSVNRRNRYTPCDAVYDAWKIEAARKRDAMTAPCGRNFKPCQQPIPTPAATVTRMVST